MADLIKKDLIHCLRSLQGVPSHKMATIEYLISKLNQPENSLPATPEGKLIAGGLLNLLAELIPQINQPKNHAAINELEKKINDAILAEMTASPRVLHKK